MLGFPIDWDPRFRLSLRSSGVWGSGAEGLRSKVRVGVGASLNPKP